MKVIGAGGFGTVYQMPNGNVIKAIVSATACDDAAVELGKQQLAYDVFENLSLINSNNPKFSTLNLINKYVRVSKPIESHDEPFVADNKQYACYFVMEKLNGIPLSMLVQAEPNSLESIDPAFIKKQGMDYEIMVQLTYNSELSEKIYGSNYSKAKISENNPPRGYFISDQAKLLDSFRELYGLTLTNDQIKEMIGFIYGILFYYGKLIPVDIEITLGYYDGEFKINVLDFGLTINLNDLANIPITPNTSEFVKILSKSIPDEEKFRELERTTIEQLSIDLYCELDEDSACRRGWTAAKAMSQQG